MFYSHCIITAAIAVWRIEPIVAGTKQPTREIRILQVQESGVSRITIPEVYIVEYAGTSSAVTAIQNGYMFQLSR